MAEIELNRELSVCDRIDIRKTGLIQNFGYLLAFDEKRSKLIAHSENIHELDPRYKNTHEALSLIEDLPSTLPELSVDFIPVTIEIRGRKYTQFAHVSPDKDVIIELEPVIKWQFEDQQVHTLTVEAAWRAARINDFDELFAEMASSVQAISKFSRVMVYKFHPDLHGEVVGELASEGQEKFLGLHYPASDIPKLARDMYLASRIRHISDVREQAAALSSKIDRAINLNGSMLRGVAPVHIQYLENMGVRSSFSISLVCHERLWGLIACHHSKPTRFSPMQRASLDLLGRTYSSAIERISARKHAQDYRQCVKHLNQLFREATLTEHLDSLIVGPQSITSLIDCDACALFDRGNLVVCSPSDCQEKLEELKETALSWSPNQLDIVAVDNLINSHKDDVYAGFLKIPIGAENGDAIIFFRKEAAREVKWAGKDAADKHNMRHDDARRLEPRGSFALWKEDVKGCSRPWSERDLNRSKLLQDFFLTYWLGLLKQRNQAVALHTKQLELFINMASHDIKSPLRAITYNVGMLRELVGNKTPKTDDLLNQAENAAFRIERILDEFLVLSAEANEKSFEIIDPAEILTQVVAEISANYPGFKAFAYDFPPSIKYTRVHFEQICANICGNAAKFAGTTQPVKVRYHQDKNLRYHQFSFSDQGPGIPKENLETIFKPFTKLRQDSHDGQGLGLAICRRILGYYGGTISARNIEPRGTEINVSIPKLVSLILR